MVDDKFISMLTHFLLVADSSLTFAYLSFLFYDSSRFYLTNHDDSVCTINWSIVLYFFFSFLFSNILKPLRQTNLVGILKGSD
jgi:hypothetical protein